VSSPNQPTDDDPPKSIIGVLLELATSVKAIANAMSAAPIDPEIRCYTAAQAADALGVSENWVVERMNAQDIPFAYIGKFRRMRAKHIRAVAEANEIDPSQRGRKALGRAA
jgi:hypothetical protein